MNLEKDFQQSINTSQSNGCIYKENKLSKLDFLSKLAKVDFDLRNEKDEINAALHQIGIFVDVSRVGLIFYEDLPYQNLSVFTWDPLELGSRSHINNYLKSLVLREDIQNKIQERKEQLITYVINNQNYYIHLEPIVINKQLVGIISFTSQNKEHLQKQTQFIELINDHIIRSFNQNFSNYRLKNVRRKLNLALEGAHAGVWEYLPDQDRFFFYDSWHRMMNKHDIPSLTNLEQCLNIIHEEDRENVLASFRKLIDGNIDNLELEFRFITRSGEEIWVLERGSIIERGAENKPTKIIGININITDRKEAEIRALEMEKAKNEAEEADRLKTEFLNNISHELRTPLNGVIGFSELITTETREEQIKEYAKNIQKSGYNLLNIIDQLLDITLIESQEMKKTDNEFCIQSLFDEIHQHYSKHDKISDNYIQLLYDNIDTEGPIIINNDRSIIKRILLSLLDNAFKFTSNGGICLGYSLETKHLELYVQDTGIGIAPSKQKIIFQRFRQVDGSQHRRFGGMGIGLFLVKSYVDLLGGQIDFNSIEKEGSEFIIKIPI
jgi:signal transduction histidine kinase